MSAALQHSPNAFNALAIDMVDHRPPVVPAMRPDPLAERVTANEAEIVWLQRLLEHGPDIRLRDVIAAALEGVQAGHLALQRAVDTIERLAVAGDRLHGVLTRMIERATMTRGVLSNLVRKRPPLQEESL